MSYGWGQISKIAKFSKIFFITTHVVHSYNDHENPFQNCEIHGSWSGVHTLGWGQYDHIVIMY